MSTNIVRRLKRLEDALTPATPDVLTITNIASATGEVISQSQLVMHPPKRRDRTRIWGEPAQTQGFDQR
jgi:hypothetical protein